MNKNIVPEEKRKFYYWLCENINTKAANYWLDGKKDKFLEEMKKDYIIMFNAGGVYE